MDCIVHGGPLLAPNFSEKLAHNGLAGRGQVRRVSHSFDAAPGGLCALEKLAHNGLANRGHAGPVSFSFGAAASVLCAFPIAHNATTGLCACHR
jgi:hypothetical protein